MQRSYDAFIQNLFHGWSELSRELRGPNGKCKCSSRIPIMTDAPFYMDQSIRYNTRDRKYLIYGRCLRCRRTAYAEIGVNDMPSFSPWVLPEALDMMAEYDVGCSHPGPFLGSHVVKDEDLYTGWLVMCDKCKSYIMVPMGHRDGLDSHRDENELVIREYYHEK